ncbi:MAG: 3-keto-5-aminohexanoate cleavage protein [Candidatus Ranarchaeia archaeon]|jgi:3-keto-5-aminohexanoate cleavage enzyme
MTIMRKAIITVALCGETTRNQTPYVPYTPKEIANSAIEAASVGATIAHIHVRNEKGKPTNDASVYSKVVDIIKKKSDIIINCTTGGEEYKEKRQVLEINPEIATLNCGSANLRNKIMINSPLELEKMSQEMKERKIKPEVMIHSQGFIHNADSLIAQGLIDPPVYYNLFFASGGMSPNLRNLSYLIDSLPPGSQWTATGSGDDAFPVAVLSLLSGGNARIGLEDCIYLSRGKLAESNAQLVKKIVRIAKELEIESATTDEARKTLNIS